MNRSPNNTGSEQLPPAQPALIYYPYDASETFPMLGTGARNAMAGPVYYHDDYASSGRNFPEFFDGKLMIYDWMRQWIFLATVNETGVEKLTPFVPNMEFSNIIDMAFGPDGALYLLEYGSGWYTQNSDAKLARIEYTAGNRAPLAKLEADQTIGGVPLTVHFTGRNSLDYDTDSLAYAWSFGPNEDSSTETNPTYTFEKPGTYPVQLTVTDAHGEATTTQTEVLVGNELPTLQWTINSGNRSFYWPDRPLALRYTIAVEDTEDGSLAEGTIDPKRVTVSFDYLPEGSDRIVEAQGHANLSATAGALVGKTLIAESDCRSCHQEETKSVGPAYRAVAERYQGDPQAAMQLAGKIIRGGSGNWGEVAMAAHPGITSAQAQQMADYILSLSDRAASASSYPPQGTYTSQAHQKGKEGGSYILTASYTDQGGQEVGELSVQQTLALHHPRREAETYEEGNSFRYPVKAADTPGLEEDITVVIGQKGKFFAFQDVDLSGVTAIKGQFALVPGVTKGGRVEYRLDGLDGELLGTATLEQHLTKMGFLEPITPISPTTGQHDVYVVFASDDPEAGVLVTVANWIEFMNENPS